MRAGCFEDNFYYGGTRLSTLSGVRSPEKCQSFCANEPECHYFTLYKMYGVCHLLAGNGLHRRGPHKHYLSGPKSCVEPKTGSYFRFFFWQVMRK